MASSGCSSHPHVGQWEVFHCIGKSYVIGHVSSGVAPHLCAASLGCFLVLVKEYQALIGKAHALLVPKPDYSPFYPISSSRVP
jgi:hypothetical protein